MQRIYIEVIFANFFNYFCHFGIRILVICGLITMRFKGCDRLNSLLNIFEFHRLRGQLIELLNLGLLKHFIEMFMQVCKIRLCLLLQMGEEGTLFANVDQNMRLAQIFKNAMQHEQNSHKHKHLRLLNILVIQL